MDSLIKFNTMKKYDKSFGVLLNYLWVFLEKLKVSYSINVNKMNIKVV